MAGVEADLRGRGPAPSPRAIVRARRRRAFARAWAEYRRNPIGMVGLAILVLFLVFLGVAMTAAKKIVD